MAAPQPVVTVVGSYAVGLVLRVERAPTAGETVIASDFGEGPGGKGSNQAIQAARLGADVALVVAVGDDAFGETARALWAREGIRLDHVSVRAGLRTGAGFILVEPDGQNRIALDPGANATLSAADIGAAGGRLAASGAVVAQLEIDVVTAMAAMRLARVHGVPAILNPAPARPINAEDLAFVDILTPNESELRVLAGRGADSAADELDDCRRLLRNGVGSIVLTRGPAGARIVRHDGVLNVLTPSVDVVDTTGAGDAFTATLAVGIAAGDPIEVAARRAVVAGALACTRMGVVPALATRDEIDTLAAAQAGMAATGGHR
jgi:ribokinase